MTSVLNSIIKLPRYVRILATNGLDQTTAIVNDSQKARFRQYYQDNRELILQKKRIYNKQPHVKQHNAQYHKEYYEKNREILLSKHKENYERRKDKNKDKLN